MITGLGIDIVQVDRVADVYRRYGFKFARRVLAPAELEAFSVTPHPVRFLEPHKALKRLA